MEVISRDRGTTFADGATKGAPQALQIADRWHFLHNLSEALEKVLAQHHADLKCLFLPGEEHPLTSLLDQQASARVKALSQAEQLRQARREQRLATFTRVQELSAQGWSGASIARMLGSHKKTAVKYAAAEHFPESRSDRDRKLAPYLRMEGRTLESLQEAIGQALLTIITKACTGVVPLLRLPPPQAKENEMAHPSSRDAAI